MSREKVMDTVAWLLTAVIGAVFIGVWVGLTFKIARWVAS